MSKETEPEERDLQPEKKSSQQLLLLILLLLIVLFAYLYFFTNVIRPLEPQPTPPPPPQAMVKKPLPPRLEGQGGEGEQAKTETGKKGAAPVAAEQAKPGPAEKAKTPAEKTPAAAEKAKSAAEKPKTGAAPAAQAAAKAAPEAKPAKPAPQQTAKAAKPEPKAAKPEAPAAKEAKTAAAKAPVAAKAPAGKPAAGEGEAAPRTAEKKVAKPAASYALEIKDDLAESEVAPVLAKLKQAGITKVVKTKTHKSEPMHRLYLADFGSQDEAKEELERLKLVTPDAFLLRENGRYAVYAGSYLRKAKAVYEQDRLLAKGVRLLLKDAIAPVPVVRVRAGAFANWGAAQKAANALKARGVNAKVVKAGS